MTEIDIAEADYANVVHTQGIVDVLNSYASDPVGGSAPLAAPPVLHLAGDECGRPEGARGLDHPDHPRGTTGMVFSHDSGGESALEGQASALEIDGDRVSAVYLDRRVPLGQ